MRTEKRTVEFIDYMCEICNWSTNSKRHAAQHDLKHTNKCKKYKDTEFIYIETLEDAEKLRIKNFTPDWYYEKSDCRYVSLGELLYDLETEIEERKEKMEDLRALFNKVDGDL